ncbi:hypothetical protein K493DRAFT_319353 [Basidiobolus meristosporus CBS 931.73]|uniref:C2H2-type domain-containing protein n=1 Tax=Basidiobolus meristosporus CBS 931.73 TaxID=1314790 RepID=A0A1Y1XS92_9FUNG|nr:hypothetical protein K493DRAFT_319353 [Basidiobolus meristosporus CBS 931.73]|eukprot:ORX88621.1 hypothetical protein K493DRAFT_319353 [Basidiobolus meristosporus CBS 931.73]
MEQNDSFLVNDFQLYDNDDLFAVDDTFTPHDEAELSIDNVFTTPFTPSIDTFDPGSLISTPYTPAVECFNDILVPFSPSINCNASMPLFNTPFMAPSNDFGTSLAETPTVVDTPLTVSLNDFNPQQPVPAVSTSGVPGFFMPLSMIDTPCIQPENDFDYASLSNTPLATDSDIFTSAVLNTPNIFSEGIDLTPFLTPATDFECDNFSAPGTPLDPANADAAHQVNFLNFGNEKDLYSDLFEKDAEKSSQALSLFAPLEEIADSQSSPSKSTSSSPTTSSPDDKDGFSVPAPQESSKSRMASAGSKKYICSYQGCSKSFARKFNLNVHQRSHFPDLARPFKCSECPKAFGRKHDLTRHLAAVHKTTSLYHCNECEKEFSRRDSLARHLEKGCQVV